MSVCAFPASPVPPIYRDALKRPDYVVHLPGEVAGEQGRHLRFLYPAGAEWLLAGPGGTYYMGTGTSPDAWRPVTLQWHDRDSRTEDRTFTWHGRSVFLGAHGANLYFVSDEWQSRVFRITPESPNRFVVHVLPGPAYRENRFQASTSVLLSPERLLILYEDMGQFETVLLDAESGERLGGGVWTVVTPSSLPPGGGHHWVRLDVQPLPSLRPGHQPLAAVKIHVVFNDWHIQHFALLDFRDPARPHFLFFRHDMACRISPDSSPGWGSSPMSWAPMTPGAIHVVAHRPGYGALLLDTTQLSAWFLPSPYRTPALLRLGFEPETGFLVIPAANGPVVLWIPWESYPDFFGKNFVVIDRPEGRGFRRVLVHLPPRTPRSWGPPIGVAADAGNGSWLYWLADIQVGPVPFWNPLWLARLLDQAAEMEDMGPVGQPVEMLRIPAEPAA